MEIQLKELIDQIKKDGVEAAESEAQAILKAANDEAEKIILSAKAEAERILQEAKKENERITKSSEDAIRQAGRNLLISFRESVARELKAIVGENVNAVYSSDAFAGLIISIVESVVAEVAPLYLARICGDGSHIVLVVVHLETQLYLHHRFQYQG